MNTFFQQLNFFLIFIFPVAIAHGQYLDHEMIELHYQVCDGSSASKINQTLKKVAGEIVKQKTIQVIYFDDQNLSFYHQGFIARLRMSKEKVDFTLKFRPTDGFLPNGEDCETEVYARDRQVTCGITRTLSMKEAQNFIDHPELLSHELNSNELNFLNKYGLKDYSLSFKKFGPAIVERTDFSENWRFEVWSLDNEKLIYEISWKGSVKNSRDAYNKKLKNLIEAGLNICPQDIKKTKATLDFYLDQ